MGELLLLISPDIDTHSRVSGLITSLIIQTVKSSGLNWIRQKCQM